MAISFRGSDSYYYGTGSPAYVYYADSGVQNDDLYIAVLLIKPSSTAVDPEVTPPPGWWQVGVVRDAGGYVDTLGTDTGDIDLFVFAGIATEDDSGFASFALTGQNVYISQMYCYRSSDKRFGDISLIHGQQATTPLSHSLSVTTDTAMDFRSGDYVHLFFGTPTDHTSSPSTPFVDDVVTADTGAAVFGNLGLQVEYGTTYGYDLSLGGWYTTVSGGDSLNTTVTWTTDLDPALVLTNIRGPLAVVRISEYGTPLLIASPADVDVHVHPVERNSLYSGSPEIVVDSPAASAEHDVAGHVTVQVDSPPATTTIGRFGYLSTSLVVQVNVSASMRSVNPATAASLGETRPVEVQVWDSRNTQMIAVLDGRHTLRWLDDLNDAGSGTVTLQRFDPKATEENLAVFNLLKFVYAGEVRFASRIEDRNLIVVKDNDYRAQEWRVDGRGALSMVSDAVLYPEYGVNEFTKPDRSFFFGSQEGSWYIASEWVAPSAMKLADVPADHPWTGFPTDWPDPAAQWLWSTALNTPAEPETVWFRSTFTLDKPKTVTVFASADDRTLVYVDGFPTLATVEGEKHSFRRASQFSMNLGAGEHLIAAEVVNSNVTLEEVQPIVTENEIRPAYANDSNRPYIGRGYTDGGNPYVYNSGAVDGGSPGSAAFDGNNGTYWLSVGNYLGWSSAYEWVEGTFAKTQVTAVRIRVRGGPYDVYVSLKNGGNGWNGSNTIPYVARSVNAGTRIRYVRKVRANRDQEIVVNLSTPMDADRIRITLHANWDSGIWQYRWRAALYEVAVTGESREGSYVRGGNFAGFLLTVAELDADGAQVGFIHRTEPTKWLVKSGDRPGWAPQHVLTKIIEEAVDRNVLGTSASKLGFTNDVDSDGQPWTLPKKDISFRVGEDYLTIIRMLTEDSGIDVWMDPDSLIIHAAPKKGENRTVVPGTVVLQPGHSLTDHSVVSGRPSVTRFVVDTDFGWMEVGNFESEAAYGRVEGSVSFGNALSFQSARDSAATELERFSIESYDTTLRHIDLLGPRPYVDYDVGDYVLAPTGFDAEQLGVHRIMSIRIAEGDAAELEVTVELDREFDLEDLSPPAASEDWPGVDEVGVPDDVTPTLMTNFNKPYENDVITDNVLVVVTDGAQYDDWLLPYIIDVQAANVSFTNCSITGPTIVASDTGLVRIATGGSASATLTRCTLVPDFPQDTIDGVRGSNFTLDRCEIGNTVDGVHIYGDLGNYNDPDAGKVTISGCWIRDLIWYDNGSHEDGTHNDCVQIRGGHGISITGNRFDGTAYNASVQVTQATQRVYDLTITDNLISSTGTSGVNIYDKQGPGAVTGLTLSNNTITKGDQTYPLLVSGTTIDDLSNSIQNNVWEDGSEPPPTVQRGA